MKQGWRRWQRRAAAYSAAVACVTFAAGCTAAGSTSGSKAPRPPATAAAGRATATPTAGGAAAAAAAPTTGSVAGACVDQALSGLSLAQQVGQLLMVGVAGDSAGPSLAAAERSYHFGSLLLTKTSAGIAPLAAQTAAMQALAPSDSGGVRLFIAANQEGGQIQQLTGAGFETMPSAVTQGGWSTGALRAAATTWGAQLHAAGVNLDLAPVMDVVPAGTAASNAPIGQLDREFGSAPGSNGAHGAAFIQGLAASGVLSVAKHFPGLGRVAGNTDFTANVVDDVTTPGDPDLGSFKTAVGAGVPMMMVALATYAKIDPTQLAVFSPAVMKLLRGPVGFGGVIVSDDLGQAVAVESIAPGERAVRFLAAGGDLITSQDLQPAEQMAAAVLAKAQGDAAFRSTVTAAARRVLTVKQGAGLLPC